MARSKKRQGFTLIELSIVLVIIGLLVGGVLVGQDLIKSAGVRAQVTQIEKYNTAVNTFRAKYNALPGDMDAGTAAQFGFAARSGLPGQGDGDGFLEPPGGLFTYTTYQSGETTMFWSDLTYANGMNINLIEGSFSAAIPTTVLAAGSPATALQKYLPAARIGRGNYIYAFSGYLNWAGYVMQDGNHFGISVPTGVPYTADMDSNPGMTVKEAYDLDKKIDDGLPMTGRVQAIYVCVNGYCYQASYTGDTPTSCFNITNTYSLSQNGGSGMNCALSIKFQ